MELKPVILLILSLLAATLALPNGAPDTACNSMTPSPGDKAHGPVVQTTNFNQNYGVTCKETQPGKVEGECLRLPVNLTDDLYQCRAAG